MSGGMSKRLSTLSLLPKQQFPVTPTRRGSTSVTRSAPTHTNASTTQQCPFSLDLNSGVIRCLVHIRNPDASPSVTIKRRIGGIKEGDTTTFETFRLAHMALALKLLLKRWNRKTVSLRLRSPYGNISNAKK
jgi:hypothetical protein